MRIPIQFPPTYQRPASRRRTDRPVTHYDYFDEAGRLLFRVDRFADPKGFRQRRPHPNSDWLWLPNLNGVRRVLYRLPELLAADRREWVFVCEGEKDADNTAAQGLVATTAPMGAGKWHLLDPTCLDYLRGRKVAIVPDNDEAGREHAAEVARSLDGIAARVCVISPPGTAEGADISDWWAVGHTKVDLLRLARNGHGR